MTPIIPDFGKALTDCLQRAIEDSVDKMIEEKVKEFESELIRSRGNIITKVMIHVFDNVYKSEKELTIHIPLKRPI